MYFRVERRTRFMFHFTHTQLKMCFRSSDVFVDKCSYFIIIIFSEIPFPKHAVRHR